MKRLQQLHARLNRLLIGAEPYQEIIPTAPPVPIREIFRRFWPYARPYKNWMLLTLLFSVLGPAIQTAGIGMFKILVDEVLVP